MKIRRDRRIGFWRIAIFSIDVSVQEDLGIADTISWSCPSLNESDEVRALRFGQINKVNFIHAIL
jgi:hypothetical protein